jgi:type IX secretion system PorP/SprF family membrane protein
MKNLQINCLKILLLACSLNLTPYTLNLAPCAFSQDIHFSQFFETPLYRNPALAGLVNGDVRVQTVYRSQWNSVSNAYKTGSVNAEYKMPVAGDDYLTLGVQVFYDRSGSANLTTTHFLPAINYHKSLSGERNMYLSLGFMGGLVQRSIDRIKIKTTSSYQTGIDGETALVPQYKYFDGSAGISFNTQLGQSEENNLVLGAAYHHFAKPSNSFFNDNNIVVSPKWVYSADVKLAVNEQSFVTIHNDHVRQGTYTETISGMLYGLKIGGYSDEPDYILQAGAFLRWDDAVIPTVQLDYHPFSVALSYDVNISRLAQTTKGRGGYELSLKYVGFLDRGNSSSNAVRCPRF